jgi:hypothetical protein
MSFCVDFSIQYFLYNRELISNALKLLFVGGHCDLLYTGVLGIFCFAHKYLVYACFTQHVLKLFAYHVLAFVDELESIRLYEK